MPPPSGGELDSGAGLEFEEGFLLRPCLPVGPIRGNGVVEVGHGDAGAPSGRSRKTGRNTALDKALAELDADISADGPVLLSGLGVRSEVPDPGPPRPCTGVT